MPRNRNIAPFPKLTLLVGSLLIAGLLVSEASTFAQSTTRTRQAKSRTTQPRRTGTSTKRTNTRKTSSSSKSSGSSATNVAAVVNGESITNSHLARQCLDRFGEQVLESLVNKFLILQECERKGIKITPKDIDTEIANIASKFNLTVENWLSLLQNERQVSPQQYRDDIIWPTLALKRLVRDELKVTKEDIDREFESEYGPKVQVRMISTKSKKKAQQILAEVNKNPKAFPTIAKNKSEDPNSAAARGLIPPIRKHMGDENIERIAFGLKPGQISGVIPFASEFVILKCERHIPATEISPQYQKMARERLRDRIVDNNLRQASANLSRKLQEDAKVVNVWNDEVKRKQMPGVAALINGKKISISKLAQECVARRGPEVLDSEINYVLLKQELKKRGDAVSKDELIAEIRRAAASVGRQDHEKWLEELTEQENISVQIYVRDAVWPTVALKKLVADQVTVSAEDLKKGFEANYGPGVEVLAIVLSNQRIAQEVWRMARANKTKEFFGELASKHSIEPVSRANMGEVPPIRRFSGQELIEKEAFTLTAKDPLSGIVSVEDRHIIMFYLGRTKPVVAEMDDEVKAELSREIREKKMRLAMANEYDRLKESSQIVNYLTGRSQRAKTASRPARTSPRLVDAPAARRVSTNGNSLKRK